ncbi:transcription repressor OFP12-like [Carya illinoinensis]|uniref:Transcription repressor n=1 Tax=Carya illinoinensis TaxID=32201 RepID=A0A8T1RNV2_CARIL|nr:transcription repressor OFP12-like [Carya illinoinensis]KAG6668389.1 hypothetical protein CIPAW_01G166800 [Carya illinoinensis]
MPKLLWRNFHRCFSKIKCLPIIESPPSPSNKHHDSQYPSPTSHTATSIIMINNFNSLYDTISSSDDPTASKSLTPSFNTNSDFFSSSDDSDDFVLTDSPPDFATIFASQRFFFSTPGSSNSIFESRDTSQVPDHNALVIPGSVQVPKYSLDPYVDFRRSMLEMVQARNLVDETTDQCEYLHQLLLCYLTLNPKHTHKYIIRAFTDLVICIFSSSPSSSAANHSRESKNRRQRYISRQLQV